MEKEAIKSLNCNLNLQMIGQGNTAEIYLYDNTKILKLFREGMPLESIWGEYKIVKAIRTERINVPEAYSIVSYKARYGILYERITGQDMIKDMFSKRCKIKESAKSLALLHSEIHKINMAIGRDVKEKLSFCIDRAVELTALEKHKIKTFLNALPGGNSLCHFDFHPGNVMVQDGAFYIIDWMTACTGDKNADVARTFLLFQFGQMRYANPFFKAAAQTLKKYIGNVYYREYKRISGISDRDMEPWILPVAAARLTEWITGSERKKLLKLIRERLKQL